MRLCALLIVLAFTGCGSSEVTYSGEGAVSFYNQTGDAQYLRSQDSVLVKSGDGSLDVTINFGDGVKLELNGVQGKDVSGTFYGSVRMRGDFTRKVGGVSVLFEFDRGTVQKSDKGLKIELVGKPNGSIVKAGSVFGFKFEGTPKS